MHMHIGALTVITTFAAVLVAGTLWRIAAVWLKDSPIGKAMAFMY